MAFCYIFVFTFSWPGLPGNKVNDDVSVISLKDSGLSLHIRQNRLNIIKGER